MTGNPEKPFADAPEIKLPEDAVRPLTAELKPDNPEIRAKTGYEILLEKDPATVSEKFGIHIELADALVALAGWEKQSQLDVLEVEKQAKTNLAEAERRLNEAHEKDVATLRNKSRMAVLMGSVAVVASLVALGIALYSQLFPTPRILSRSLIEEKLLGEYQVVLGPNGGCKGGPRNTKPAKKATIKRTPDGKLEATNECDDKTIITLRYGTADLWGTTAFYEITGDDVTFIDAFGNSWVKLKTAR